MLTGAKRITVVALGVLFVFMFVSIDLAYALGGGGGHGDGRQAFSQPNAPANSASGSGNGQQASSGSGATDTYSRAGSYSGFIVTMLGYHWTQGCGNDVVEEGTFPVPEPATALMLVLGLVGLAGARRKFFKN